MADQRLVLKIDGAKDRAVFEFIPAEQRFAATSDPTFDFYRCIYTKFGANCREFQDFCPLKHRKLCNRNLPRGRHYPRKT
jgi:hypothetical protein